jgi:Putative beta-barrel porin-2, OmpL-like. bbp2
MACKRSLHLGVVLLLGVLAAEAQAQVVTGVLPPSTAPAYIRTTSQQVPPPAPLPNGGQPAPDAGTTPPSPLQQQAETTGQDAPATTEEEQPGLGPTPLDKVGIFQNLLFGDKAKDSKIKVSGWIDLDYTFRSTGPGENNIAPVENRFGDEFLARELGLLITKPLDPKELSWGFNVIYFGGSDASFIQPTAGYPAQTNPRFGQSFTDLNLTAHLPILTEGGVDIKAGRQTTVLGPMGALAWQRYFDSSDYAWFNLEEGRYTGVSANWYITKQLSWYNGIEIGGWGVFFDNPAHGVDWLTQINYWLDKEAKKTKLWLTVLTGPTGFFNDGNTTAVEVGVQENWNKYWYQIVDFQMNYSKAPIFFAPPPGYQQRAYDVYTYVGRHLSKTVDFNSRFEWYKDVDGGGYPGGFGIPHTDYYEMTFGVNYHPTKWVEFRPEIRYDHATHPAFGSSETQKNQLSIAADVLIKF